MKICHSDIELLINDFYSCALKTIKLNVFCDYAFNKINEYLKIDSASVNLCVIKENMELTELKCYFFKQPQKMESSYYRMSNKDFFTPALISDGFTAKHAMDLISRDSFQETDLYLNHCRHYYVQNAIATASKFPGHKNKFIIVYLYSHEPSRLFLPEEISFLESIFPALITIIRYQLNLVCNETLKDEIESIRPICAYPEQMKLVRCIVNHPTYTRKEIAKYLAKSPSTVDTQLQSIFEKLGIRKGEEINQDKWNVKCELIEKLSFLK
jgi:hypothetical protein